MAEKHLGLPFDIHGGGADLKFPHHENEIAQSCCAHGITDDPHAFASVWVHNGFLTVEGEKMSKSLGNFLLTHDVIKDTHGEVLRMVLLAAHYRQPLDWSAQAVQQAGKYLDRLYHLLRDMKDVVPVPSAIPEAILDALCDDLNTPMAFAAINDLTRAQPDKAVLKGQLLALGNLLGILQSDPDAWFGYGAAGDGDAARIDALLAERGAAKQAKNFARADDIRKSLEGEGIMIEDTPAGPKWRRA
jgi:cysteinyl-tRNA synthetase